MSEGIWDGGTATICPHGNSLNLDDAAPCGCRVRIVTKEDLVIYAGPYNPKNKVLEREYENGKRGPKFPEGRVVPLFKI